MQGRCLGSGWNEILYNQFLLQSLRSRMPGAGTSVWLQPPVALGVWEGPVPGWPSEPLRALLPHPGNSFPPAPRPWRYQHVHRAFPWGHPSLQQVLARSPSWLRATRSPKPRSSLGRSCQGSNLLRVPTKAWALQWAMPEGWGVDSVLLD